MLAGFSCMAASVGVLTQFFKGLFDKLPIKMPTRAVSYIFALVLLIGTTYFTGAGGMAEYFLCPVNAVFVSFSSNGAFDFIKSISDKGDSDA